MPDYAYPVMQRPDLRLPSHLQAIALCAALALGAGACSGGAANTRPAVHPTAAELYQAGHAAVEQESYAGAAASFRRLESLYPGDPDTLQGQVELVYAYYMLDETASVLVNAERFILEQPSHPNVDYVHYLRGLAMYNKAMEALALVSVEVRPRPPTADLALEYFNILLRRFPASKYAEDARNRIVHLENALAAFELATAKIYLNRGDYINAGLHARAALENYPDASVKTEAATVANMAYRMLDLQTPPPLPTGAAAAADGPRPEIGVDVPETAAVPRPEPVAVAPAAAAAPTGQSMPAEAAPSAAVTPALAADAVAQREDWIARQNPDAYTIQLFSVSDPEAVLAFIQAHPLGELAFFEFHREGYPWYSLIHGVYADAATAHAAAATLPAGLRLPQPWIRRLGDIQAVIAAQGAQASTPP